jgi:DHA1 family multidrug resistance protein-like MFS transporter
MLFGPFWGALADRVGQKPMMLRSLAGLGIVFLLQAAVSDPWLFMGLRLSLGVFAGINAATLALVAAVIPRERLGLGLGWVQTGRFVGSTAGPAIGGLLGDLLGFRAAYVVAGVVSVALFAASAAALPNPAPVAKGRGGHGLRAGLRYVGANRALLPLVLVIFFVQFGLGVVQPYIPFLVERLVPTRENLASTAGVIISAGSLTAAASGLAAGWLADRHGYLGLIVAGAALSAVFQVLHVLVQTTDQLFAVRFLMGLTYGGLQPLVNGLIALMVPRERTGLVFGLASSAQAAGNLLGPILGSLIAVGFGLDAPFYLGAAMLALLAIVALRFVREPPRGAAPDL